MESKNLQFSYEWNFPLIFDVQELHIKYVYLQRNENVYTSNPTQLISLYIGQHQLPYSH